jgi:GPI inositol-deacylase
VLLIQLVVSLDPFPSVAESLRRYVWYTMTPLAGILLLASCLPFDPGFMLGNSGEIVLAPLASLVLFVASGCVVLSWGFLRVVTWTLLKVVSIFGRLVSHQTVRALH